jgi:prepilin-type N-terminal cleavage/methylation domain-containing protein
MNRSLCMLKNSPSQRASAFTLIEILIVLTIVSILAAALGVTITNMMATAREAQTTATLRKVDGLITERLQGLQRSFESSDFRRHENKMRIILANSTPVPPALPGLSKRTIAVITRKELTRETFPQRFIEMVDVRGWGSASPDGIPDRIQFDEVYGGDDDLNNNGVLDGDTTAGNGLFTEDRNDNGVFDPSPLRWTSGTLQNHSIETESAELLYFAITRMEVFGAPLVGVDEFSTREVGDTDNDGLPEFVDGWGNPLRFYRWPTRLFKPYGLFGRDQNPGATGDDSGSPPLQDFNDLYEIGWRGTDDLLIDVNPQFSKDTRFMASLYFDGIPRVPTLVGTPPAPLVGDEDQLNVDPDDQYGIVLEQAKIYSAAGIPMLDRISESRYHTLDTWHRPLVVSAGADGVLGLYEPFHNEDTNLDGLLNGSEDANGNGNGILDLGILAQLLNEDTNLNGVQDGSEVDLNGNGAFDTFASPLAAYDDLTNLNRRAGE